MIRTKSIRCRHVAAVVLLALLATTTPAGAQSGVRDWNNQGDPLQGAVGLHYGRVGGHGLAFRLPTSWFLYLQLAGGVWHKADRKRHNFGVELNYILRQDDRIRIYLGGGVGYFYDKEKVGTTGGVDEWRTNTDWNAGLGVGLEVLQGRRWSWQIEGNFAHMGSSGDITVLPQFGVYFYW